MSQSFTVTCSPDHAQILAQIALEDLTCCEEAVPEGLWPEGTLHYYRAGVSCRAVEITREAGRLEIRALACSCPEDIDLANRFLSAFGATGAFEDRGQADLRALSGEISRSGQTFTMDGPVRPFHIGPRLLSEIGEHPERLYQAMRRVQYVEDAFAANVLQVAAPEPFTVTGWTKGVRTLFPAVDYVVLEDNIFLPSVALPQVVGERFQWLDEKQSLVEPFEGEDWKRLLERVQPHRAYPVDPPRAKPERPWWRFWSHS